ncbi:MAG: hypothetical protein R8M46_02040 [Ghiorsea sp.]
MKFRFSYAALTLGLVTLGWPIAHVEAGLWDSSGEATFETRYFPHDVAYPSQENTSTSASLTVQPEVVYESDDGNHRFTVSPFARWDSKDDQRTHVDMRELNWLYFDSTWDLNVGVSKVYWGVTESAHLVDIINQTDNVEGITGEEKLGQPMVNLNLEQNWGSLNLFVLPGFRQRSFAADDARLHGPLPIDDDNSTYESANEERHVDWAARWAQTFGSVDMALSHFQGTSREARLLASSSAGNTVLVPQYDLIAQTGLELQLTTNNTLWKAEAISRSGQGDRFYAVVGGFEHTLYGVSNSVVDVGLLLEYLYDNRDVHLAPPSIAEHDVFGGFRVALNDTQDTAILFGTLYDYQTDAAFINFEAERRLTDYLKLEINSRFMVNIPDNDSLAFIQDDDFFELKLSYFF